MDLFDAVLLALFTGVLIGGSLRPVRGGGYRGPNAVAPPTPPPSREVLKPSSIVWKDSGKTDIGFVRSCSSGTVELPPQSKKILEFVRDSVERNMKPDFPDGSYRFTMTKRDYNALVAEIGLPDGYVLSDYLGVKIELASLPIATPQFNSEVFLGGLAKPDPNPSATRDAMIARAKARRA